MERGMVGDFGMGRPFMAEGMGVEDGDRTRIRSDEDVGGVGEWSIEDK